MNIGTLLGCNVSSLMFVMMQPASKNLHIPNPGCSAKKGDKDTSQDQNPPLFLNVIQHFGEIADIIDHDCLISVSDLLSQLRI